MLAAFTSFYTIDVNTGVLTPTDNTHPAELPVPLVFSTPDGSAAMGAMASPATHPSFAVTYAKYNFADMQPFDNGTTKWSNVFRSGPHAKVYCVCALQYLHALGLKARFLMLFQGTVLAYTSYLCIGQLQRVAACMAEIYKAAAAASTAAV